MAVKNCIPVSDSFKRDKNSNIVAGWNDQARPFRDNAKFLNAIWVSCGRPLNCQVYSVMKRTKNVFNFVVRKIKKNKEKLEPEKMCEPMIHGNVTNLVKKLLGLKNCLILLMEGWGRIILLIILLIVMKNCIMSMILR